MLSQVRDRDGVLCESDAKVQESCALAQAVHHQQQIAESALRTALASAEGNRKRHAHELATLHQMLGLVRQVCSSKEEEAAAVRTELAAAQRALETKDEQLKVEVAKCEEQVAQARARALHLVQEHRRRSASPGHGHMSKGHVSKPRDNFSPASAAGKPTATPARKAHGDVKDELLEGELECQFRLEALADAEVRPELLRVGLANVMCVYKYLCSYLAYVMCV